MIDDLPPHGADRMPTLTEVLELDDAAPAGGEADAAPQEGLALPPPEATPSAAVPPLPDTEALVREVLAELQPRIDMLFESRLREALAPALARAADVLIREARGELGSALHELVDEAVKRALQRRGGQW